MYSLRSARQTLFGSGMYKISKKLHTIKDESEKFLSTKTNELFDLQDTVILYDLTNTYFEGVKNSSNYAQFGRSKEKRSDAKIISLALIIPNTSIKQPN